MGHDIDERIEKLKKAGQRLRKLRGDRTMSDVSKTLGICHSAIGRYERGELMPKQATMENLAGYYNSSPYKIWGNLRPVSMSEVMLRSGGRTKRDGDSHPEAIGTFKGSEYKIGRNGWVFYLNSEREWRKSSMEPKDFKKHVKEYA